MRALRVVGITEGGGEICVVLEDPDRRERFMVPADEQLRAAARGDLARLGQIAIELESQLRPREIQARIRSGASVEQVASAAGVPLQKIERFAYPVLLERSRTADVAQRAHPVRADGPDIRTLGDVVAHTFGLRGQEYTDAEWDSWKGEDGKWVVALSWHAGRSDNRAHWTFQPGAHGGTVTAVDEHANDLVEGLPARPLRTVGPVIDIARTEDPTPAPAPGEELRAAASDTVRSGRIDTSREHSAAPETRTVDRAPSRTAPEPRRPLPPTQRPAPVEPARTESPRTESPRTESQRTESPRTESPRTESPRTESPRTESPRIESPRTEAARTEQSRTEPSRTEPSRSEQNRPEHDPDRPAQASEATRPERGAPTAARTGQGRSDQPPARTERQRAEPARDEAATDTGAAGETGQEAPEPPAAAASADPDASPQQPASGKRTKKGKPVMPSWDEVLLGVRGQR
jgi:hypothetical protein